MYIVTTAVKEQILSHLTDSEEVEVCGLVYGETVYQVRNVHPKPDHYFEMDPQVLAELWSRYGTPDAIWHSHPTQEGEPYPSDPDLIGAPAAVPYIIVNARGEIGVWVF